MKIFIPRVPNTVTASDLRKFTTGILKKKLHIPFTSHPGITSCDILQIKDMQLGITEHHGVVSIWPDSAARWFMQKLKNQRLHNKLIHGREFFHRGDGRSISPEKDRRRKHLEISKMEVQNIRVEGFDNLAQTRIS